MKTHFKSENRKSEKAKTVPSLPKRKAEIKKAETGLTCFVSRFPLSRFSLFILLSLVSRQLSPAQLQLIDLTTPHTNVTINSALLSIPNLCTNASYTASNPAAVTLGDSWNTVGGKINSSFNFCSNQFNLVLNLQNEVVSNWQACLVSLSNLTSNTAATNGRIIAALNLVSNNFVMVSNNFAAVSNLFSQNDGVFTNQAGARFRLMVNAGTNGFVFLPQ